MNAVRKINDINLAELESGTSDDASWHYEYRDTPYIFIGGLPYSIEEKDLVTIFSQYGIVSHVKLVRDRDTKRSKGFAYLRYRNCQSCVLAVDNFNGIKVYDRIIKVDHVYYSLKAGENENDYMVDYSAARKLEIEYKEHAKGNPLLEIEHGSRDRHASDDPMSLLKDGAGPDQTGRGDASVLPLKGDELADPMLSFNDNDFTDPMASFVEKPKKRHRKHHEGLRKRERAKSADHGSEAADPIGSKDGAEG